jgi:hypothetical protein
MKSTSSPTAAQKNKSNRVIRPGWLAMLVAAFALAFLFGTNGFQTFWSKERRLVAAADEIVIALKAYRDASPGTDKTYPLQLLDITRDPRMLADKGYLLSLPVDPITLKQEWGVIKNKNDQVIGVHSLSNEMPTLFSKFFLFQRGEKYSDWKFLAE